MFGMAHLKGEGMPVHPDEIEGDLSDEQRARQLQAYQKAVPGRIEPPRPVVIPAPVIP